MCFACQARDVIKKLEWPDKPVLCDPKALNLHLKQDRFTCILLFYLIMCENRDQNVHEQWNSPFESLAVRQVANCLAEIISSVLEMVYHSCLCQAKPDSGYRPIGQLDKNIDFTLIVFQDPDFCAKVLRVSHQLSLNKVKKTKLHSSLKVIPHGCFLVIKLKVHL